MPLPHRLRFLYGRFHQAGIQTRSAALAYHSLLAVVPVIGLVFLYLRRIGLSQRWYRLTQQYLLARLNLGSDSALLRQLAFLTSEVHRRSWGLLGFVIVAYTSWNLIGKFEESLDAVLDTAEDQHHAARHGTLMQNFKRLVVILTLPVALMLSLAAGQWIRRDSWLRLFFDLQAVGPLIAVPIAWGVDIVAFCLVYYFVPSRSVPFRQALKAALVAGPVAELTRIVFGVYGRHTVSMHRIYGIFVVVPLFILWFQIAWMITLSSALFIRFAPRRRARLPEDVKAA